MWKVWMLGSVKCSKVVKCLALSFSVLVFLSVFSADSGVLVPGWQQWLTRSLSQGQRLPHHTSISLPSLLSSLASFPFSKNVFSDMLSICGPYIAKVNFLVFLSCSLSFLSPTTVICQSYRSLASQSYSVWLFCQLPLLLVFLKFFFLFLPQKTSSHFLVHSVRYLSHLFQAEQWAFEKKKSAIYFSPYASIIVLIKWLNSAIMLCAQRLHDMCGIAG